MYGSMSGSSLGVYVADRKRGKTRGNRVCNVLLVIPLLVCVSPEGIAQQAGSVVALQPMVPIFATSAADCDRFGADADRYIEGLGRERSECTSRLTTAELMDWVDSGPNCHEWSGAAATNIGACTTSRRCAALDERWFGAVLWRTKAMQACREKVRRYEDVVEAAKKIATHALDSKNTADDSETAKKIDQGVGIIEKAGGRALDEQAKKSLDGIKAIERDVANEFERITQAEMAAQQRDLARSGGSAATAGTPTPMTTHNNAAVATKDPHPVSVVGRWVVPAPPLMLFPEWARGDSWDIYLTFQPDGKGNFYRIGHVEYYGPIREESFFSLTWEVVYGIDAPHGMLIFYAGVGETRYGGRVTDRWDDGGNDKYTLALDSSGTPVGLRK